MCVCVFLCVSVCVCERAGCEDLIESCGSSHKPELDKWVCDVPCPTVPISVSLSVSPSWPSLAIWPVTQSAKQPVDQLGPIVWHFLSLRSLPTSFATGRTRKIHSQFISNAKQFQLQYSSHEWHSGHCCRVFYTFNTLHTNSHTHTHTHYILCTHSLPMFVVLSRILCSRQGIIRAKCSVYSQKVLAP